MSRSPGLVLAAFLSLLAASLPAAALEARLASDETTVVLRTDGKATVTYRLEWNVTGGAMHGFYFQGESFEPVWDMRRCWADLPDGELGSALSIKDLGDGKYDVVLAGGRDSPGKSYYNLTYGGDFAGEGLVGATTSEKGEKLVFFDWGPVAWDDPSTTAPFASSCRSRSNPIS